MAISTYADLIYTNDINTNATDGTIMFNTVDTNFYYSDSGQYIQYSSPGITTTEPGITITEPGITYGADYTTDYVHYNSSGTNLYDSVINILTYPLFENEIIKITEKGDIFINGKQETNPAKIGLALIQAVNSIKEKSNVINSIDEL